MQQSFRSRRLALRRLAFACALLFGLAGGAAASGLPPEMEADRLLLVAQERMAAEDWAGARGAMESILELGISVPDAFFHHYARILLRDGAYREAEANAAKYLQRAGRGGEHYTETLRIFNTARTEQAAAEAAARQAELDRRAALVGDRIRAWSSPFQTKMEFGRRISFKTRFRPSSGCHIDVDFSYEYFNSSKPDGTIGRFAIDTRRYRAAHSPTQCWIYFPAKDGSGDLKFVQEKIREGRRTGESETNIGVVLMPYADPNGSPTCTVHEAEIRYIVDQINAFGEVCTPAR